MAKLSKSQAPLSEPRQTADKAAPAGTIEVFSGSEDDAFEDFSGFASTDDEAQDEPINSENAQKAAEQIASLAEKSGARAKDGSSERGVVYVGRIPHGLYEDQLRQYLSQFGTITRIRISRNKNSGASKHYGFIEFASKDVAQIVCETMNNYLLFGHLLKVKMMDAKQVHPDLWIGANKKFHAVPWGQVKKRQAERKHPREWWEARQEEFNEERKAKMQRLAELGIRY